MVSSAAVAQKPSETICKQRRAAVFCNALNCVPCSPLSSHVETPAPSVIVCGDIGPLRKQLSEVIRVVPEANGDRSICRGKAT